MFFSVVPVDPVFDLRFFKTKRISDLLTGHAGFAHGNDLAFLAFQIRIFSFLHVVQNLISPEMVRISTMQGPLVCGTFTSPVREEARKV